MVPALTIMRSLARIGVTADVASHHPHPLTRHSRHLGRLLTYPDPLTQEAAFVDWAAAVLARGYYRLVIPVTERSLVPLLGLVDGPGGEALAVAPRTALGAALDKSLTLALAARLGISAPRSVAVETAEDLAQAMPGLTLPVVIKPARSIGASGAGRRQLSVEYAQSPGEFEAKAKHALRFGAVLLQEYVVGQGVGIELIADHGEVVYAFQHLRLHEVPLTGGGSSLRVSVPIEPLLLDASRRLMAELAWHGVAMVEFKWDPATRAYALMEINGRFWGSLPLAVAAGADFPAMLYELLVEGRVQPRPDYRIGVYARKLSSDLGWLEQVLRRDAPPGLVQFPTRRRILADTLLMLSPRHVFDVQSWRDPIPGLVDLGCTVATYAERLGRHLRERRARRVQMRRWRNGEAAERLRGARQILFLCYGNINRSALAERYFLEQFPEANVRVVSAGFHPEEGRPADPVMVEVAAEAGVDLGHWSSRRLSPELVGASDAILVMEHAHAARLNAEFPDTAGRTFLLGMAPSPDGPAGEIDDPYGKPRADYARCAREVQASVRVVGRMVGARASPGSRVSPEAA